MKVLSINLIILLFVAGFSFAGNKSGDWESLFNGKDLTGWKQLNGQAKYEVVNGEIVGTTVADTPNSFLTTEKNYGDFVLELELLVANHMNSGIQFRSESTPEYNNGRVHGYQCEVDPSGRAWSGGIYDEARRGWLYPCTYNPEGGKAFKIGEWNKYRIECIGSSIRTWVNGVPVAHLIDDMTSEGFICLQVHSIGKDGVPGSQIRWRNIRIQTKNIKPSPIEDVFVVNLLPNNLSETEKSQDWKLLYDGKTSNGWKSASGDNFPENGWSVNDGTITVLSKDETGPKRGGDIVTTEKYKAFSLQFEFRLTEGANSGVKYGLGNNGPSIGLEYQVLSGSHPDAKMGVVGNRTIGSLYDLIPSEKNGRFLKKDGEWNQGRIVLYPDNRVEHWLNGLKVVEYVRGSNIYNALVARSKYAEFENFGMAKETPVLLQDHSDHVSFRSIKIKKLN